MFTLFLLVVEDIDDIVHVEVVVYILVLAIYHAPLCRLLYHALVVICAIVPSAYLQLK